MTEGGSVSIESDLWLDSVRERDIDLLLIEELVVNTSFASWFADEAFGGTNEFACVLSVKRSVVDAQHGETDIQFVFKTLAGDQAAVLIENKIDAPPQSGQAERYLLRAQSGLDAGRWSDWVTCLCAPERYLSNPAYADGYQLVLSYESVRDWFLRHGSSDPRLKYKARIMNEAIEQNRRGYTAVVDPRATAFWHDYWDVVNLNHPELELRHPGNRPAGSTWIQFRPARLPRGWVLQHKAERGDVDLELRGMAGALEDYRARFSESLPNGIEIVRASKSLAFRQRVVKLDHFKPFADQRKIAEEAMHAVSRMLRFAIDLEAGKSNQS